MNARTLRPVRVGLAAGLVLAGLTLVTASAPRPRGSQEQGTQTFAIDSGHSSVVFKVKHLDVTWFYGRFNEIRGSYTLDLDDPTRSSVQLEIPTASIDTNDGGRDKEMRSPAFFDAEAHPAITFQTKKVKVLADDHWELVGELGCKGQVHEVTVDLRHTGTADHPRFGYRTGFEASFELDRMAFDVAPGMSAEMLGETVHVVIGIEGIRE